MNEMAMERLDMVSGLLHNEMVFHYQPIVSSKTREVIGIEALMRWCRAGTLISPIYFIDELTEHIIRKPDDLGSKYIKMMMDAISDLKGIHADAYISFNLHIDQLMDPAHGQMLISVLRHATKYKRQVVFEILEAHGNTIHTPEEINSIISLLKAQGAKFAIDDYGVGASNILRLLDMPVDIVKLDRLFVKKFVQDGKLNTRSLGMVRHMVKMFNYADISTVVIEGIQNNKEREAAESIGIDSHQGYYYSPAIELKDLRYF